MNAMQMTRTFHQTGTELTEREVTTAAEYPGTKLSTPQFTFNPNPLQPNTLIQYSNTWA